MKHLFILFICIFLSLGLSAQKFSRVRIHANHEQINSLLKQGVCIDHGKHKENTWVETDLSMQEIEIVNANGIKVELLIDDVVKHYQEQSATREMRSTGVCANNIINYNTPVHFKLGSMGGYPTYSQIISELDSMYLLYPSLIKQKTPIGTYTTQNGNSIHWVKISNNPSVDETEPEILFTALHHAREPVSITQTLYFMWYLLENYGTNPEITYLIDNTEIYFVPVVNPDGYLHNESIAPTGGGMWRKNRRNNLDGTFGVDLNRNYSYQWGVSGSSSTTSSDVYRGATPFSEPETQALRDFTLAHQFKFALNYHTYGNLLLYPYGYGYVDAVDKDYYHTITNLMVEQNDFVNESSVTLYPAAGDSDDWGYGDTITKPRVFSMTPETGSDVYGFWPPSAQIENLSAATLFQNITALNLLHYYCNANDANHEVFRNPGLTHYFKFNVEKLGLETIGTSSVSIIPLTPEIISVGSPKTFTNVVGYLPMLDSIDFTLASTTAQGQELKFILQTTNASGTVNDTVTKYFGMPHDIFNADFSSLSSFVNAGFGMSASQFVSPSSSLTDSPSGNYGAGANLSIVSGSLVIPATSAFAQLKFNAKWAIEKGYDYAQVLISSDGGLSYTALCGKYTSTGTSNQDQGQPLYDGIMSNWVLEEINLNNYIGSTVQFKILFKSDPGLQMDGIYIDDMIVEIINPNGIEENLIGPLVHVYPNPVNNELTIVTNAANQRYALFDNCGREITSGTLMQGNNKLLLDQYANGNYILSLSHNGIKQNFKITIIK